MLRFLGRPFTDDDKRTIELFAQEFAGGGRPHVPKELATREGMHFFRTTMIRSRQAVPVALDPLYIEADEVTPETLVIVMAPASFTAPPEMAFYNLDDLPKDWQAVQIWRRGIDSTFWSTRLLDAHHKAISHRLLAWDESAAHLRLRVALRHQHSWLQQQRAELRETIASLAAHPEVKATWLAWLDDPACCHEVLEQIRREIRP